ncbi:hypothetical protein F4827_002212 [Paraburkholderia bannensis]|uniref:Uncharacterized protein n=1 Tax=Paraburkholderia bannensis TaxID=765414 RepID=A0A7W9TVU5_9BURK|nr:MULTISPECIES: hypothetical protein [Paraburkholderia]MBB3257241.1 hypothetical protein [Paraburkholderia sp. WP4_3_2]MBB6102363.1 hypothetical protein [Paraburkholderia bannensis]
MRAGETAQRLAWLGEAPDDLCEAGHIGERVMIEPEALAIEVTGAPACENIVST